MTQPNTSSPRHELRVLTVGNMYPPHHRGGYELLWGSAVDHLRRAGHEVRVLTTTHQEPDVSSDEGSDVFRELRWYWSEEGWPRLSGMQRLRLERHNQRVLKDHIDEFVPDVVCWWAMGGMSLSLIERVGRLDIAEAFVLCDDWLRYAPSVDGWMRAMRRLRTASGIAEALTRVPSVLTRQHRGPALFLSEWLKVRGHEAGWRFAHNEVVGPGVPSELFHPEPVRDWGWRIACIGRLDERKGVDLAIGALAHLPDDASLEIVGSEGSRLYRDELDALVDRLGLEGRVTFSSLPRERLRSAYANADVVTFPVRWPEPWGLVPLEAMAVGRPVVATGRGGSGEYLRDRDNCVLFDPDEGAAALASAIRQLADDPALRERILEGGFATTQDFGEDDLDRAVEDLVQRAAISHR